MNKWEKVLLQDVAFFQEGPGLRNWQWRPSGMKVINVTNILGDAAGTVDISNTDKYVSMEEFATKYSHFAVEDGDIVVASSGNTYGKCGRITKRCLPLMMNTSVIRFHVKDSGRLVSDYLYAFLRSKEFKNQIEQYVIGGAQPNFGPSHVKKMTIRIPPLAIQRRIADILSAYDDLIENNCRRIEILEETARLKYRKMVVSANCGGLIELGALALFSRGKVITQKTAIEGDVPVVAGGVAPAYYHNSANTLSPVITISGSGANAGYTRMYFERIWASDCSWIDASRTDHLYFVYCYLKENADVVRNLQQGAAQPHVYPKDINALPVPKLADEYLVRFEKDVGMLFEQQAVLSLQNAKLAAARDMLLPRLMSGKLEVA